MGGMPVSGLGSIHPPGILHTIVAPGTKILSKYNRLVWVIHWSMQIFFRTCLASDIKLLIINRVQGFNGVMVLGFFFALLNLE
jgi:hypothetical protein